MKRYLLPVCVLLITLSFSSCSYFQGKSEKTVLDFENITIYADLSGRLDRNPGDREFIDTMLDYFVESCAKPGEGSNDRSAIRFSRLNYNATDCPVTEIDLDRLASRELRQKYIDNSIEAGGLAADVSLFADGVNCHYQTRDEEEADAIALIAVEVSKGDFIKQEKVMIDGRDTLVFQYHNRLFVFTDGYLGFSGQEIDGEFQLGEKELDDIRNLCRSNDMTVYELLRVCPELRIRPFKHANNALVDLYIVETDDRGFDPLTGNLSNPGPLSDNNILKAFWEFWAAESGYKSLTWKPFSRQGQLNTSFIKDLFHPLSNTDQDLLQGLIPYGAPGNCPDAGSSSSSNSLSKPELRKESSSNKTASHAPIVYPPVEEAQIRDYELPRNSVVVRQAAFLSLPDQSTVEKIVPKGMEIEVLGYGGGYYKVVVDGQRGYMVETNVKTYKNEAW